MIEELRKALANYEEYIDIQDHPDKNEVIVEITEFIGSKAKFDGLVMILKTQYNAAYVPYKKGEHNAFFIIQKSKPELPKQNPEDALRFHLEQALRCLDDIEKVKK